MTEEQRAQIERRLLAAHERAQRALRDLQARVAGDSRYTDGGAGAREAGRALALAERAGRHLDFIDAALERLRAEPERFGRCEACSRPIPMDRLLEAPDTRHCLSCRLLLEA